MARKRLSEVIVNPEQGGSVPMRMAMRTWYERQTELGVWRPRYRTRIDGVIATYVEGEARIRVKLTAEARAAIDALGSKPVAAVTRSDVMRVANAIRPGMADSFMAIVSSYFGSAYEQGIVTGNPARNRLRVTGGLRHIRKARNVRIFCGGSRSKPLQYLHVAAITSAIYSDRVLGVSQKVSVPTTATWLLTGNSIEFVGDLTTRVLLSVLDPEMENPEARPFRRNLAEYVLEHRGALVSAALTIPLAYAAAGSPKVDAARSRFLDWDRLVRNPLLWVGAADPLDTQAELRANDPVREALVAIHMAWIDAFGSAPATVADAVDAANGKGQSERVQLAEALRAVAGERNGEINTRRLGRHLARNVRRIENGRRFENAGTDLISKNRRYALMVAAGVTGVTTTQRAEIGG